MRHNVYVCAVHFTEKRPASYNCRNWGAAFYAVIYWDKVNFCSFANCVSWFVLCPVKVVVSKIVCEIDTLFLHTINRRYHMAYRFVPFPVTLKVIRLLQDLSNAIWWTFAWHFARFQLKRCVAWSLGSSWASCLKYGFSALTLLVGRQEENRASKNWGVDVVICLERGVDCLHMVQLMPLHPQTPSSLTSFKSRLVLPFWYRLPRLSWKRGR